jgi:CheY-like chemotaxis protein
MTSLHVLIVDDDPALLQALPEALRLRMDGVAVDVADSGAAALDRIATLDYDVIVTDIKMPGMDGLALLAEIRGTSRFKPCAGALTTSCKSRSTVIPSWRRCTARFERTR